MEQSGVVRGIIDRISVKTGEKFLNAMVKELHQQLECDVVFVADFDRSKGLVVCHWTSDHDKLAPGTLYALEGSPCSEIKGGSPRFIGAGAADEYPDDTILKGSGYQAFYGYPLYTEDDEILGILVALDANPRDDDESLKVLMSACAARAGAEISRLRFHGETLSRRLNGERTRNLIAMGTLATGLAHDFNNLLSAIQMNLEVISERGGDLIDDALRDALDACEIAGQLSQRTLDFGRNVASEKGQIEVASVVDSVFQHVCAEVDSGVNLVKTIDDDVVDVHSAPGGLFQILYNLVINACQVLHGVGGEIVVTARTMHIGSVDAAHYDITEGDYVCFAVTDDGPGIDPENLEVIFSPDFSTKPRRRNSGLGLGIVRETIRGHNGAIEVESTRGEGTTFRFWLPAMPDEE